MSNEVVWVIVVGGGSGQRFGAPKQYCELGDRTVLDHSLTVARSVADGVIAVVPLDRVDDELVGVAASVPGGASRSDSVRAGLSVVPDDATVVLVHDAARPLASADLFERVIAGVVAGADAVVPVVPVNDTIVHVDDGTLDRSKLRSVQTPQGFRAGALRSAHLDDRDSTDDASLVEADGGVVKLIEGEPNNFKITRPLDLVVAAHVMSS